jgi:hypothetical protein
MANIPENVKWYLAELVEEIKIEGERENVIHNNLVLIYANSPEEAYEKAMARGKEVSDTYENPDGKHVTVTFRGLSDLNVILDELEDGAEIAYEEMTGLSESEIAEMLPPKEQLSVFLEEEPDPSRPNNMSKDVVDEAMRIIRNSRPEE